MAKQAGILPIEGTIGNITFFKSKDGFMVRQKGGISAEKIAHDPAFKRTRENGAEFGRAGKAGKLLRAALRSLLVRTRDKRMVSRLTARFVKVIQEDQVNNRGLRNVIDGEAMLLQGFEFNKHANLSSTLYEPITPTIDRVNGLLKVEVPIFDPAKGLAIPPGATHFKIHAAGTEVDFENEVFVSDFKASANLALNAPTPQVTLTANVTPASTHPLILVVGIEFMQEVNGAKYPLNNGSFNAASIVKVDA